MSEETTIPLPGGLEYRDLQRGCGNGNVRDATGKIVSWLYRSQAEKLSAAMNAAQATAPPSLGDVETCFERLENAIIRGDGTTEAISYLRHAVNAALTAPTTNPGAAGQPVSGSGGVPRTVMQAALDALDCSKPGWLEKVLAAALAAAPTPPATASSGAAVEISVEEVERLAAKALSLAYAAGRGDGVDVASNQAYNALLAAILSLAAQQDKGGVREAALEEAAREIEGKLTGNVRRDAIRAAQAKRIRALKTAATADQPGREGDPLFKVSRPMSSPTDTVVTNLTREQFRQLVSDVAWRIERDDGRSAFPSSGPLTSEEQAVLRGLEQRDVDRSRAQADVVAIDVQRMNTTRGPDFFVRFRCDGREATPYVFRERYKAEYEAAHYAWVFGLRSDKPDLMAYDETTYPNEEQADA